MNTALVQVRRSRCLIPETARAPQALEAGAERRPAAVSAVRVNAKAEGSAVSSPGER